MMKMSPPSWVALVLTIASVHILGDAGCPTRRYQLLFNGKEKFSGPYVQHNTANAAGCTFTCNTVPGCWVYTWDTQTKECSLLQKLSWPVTKEDAPPSLLTYYVRGMNGKGIEKTSSTGSWSFVKAGCEVMGGRLFLPSDSTYAVVLHYILGTDMLWIGMTRKPTDDMYTWFDLDGNPANPDIAWVAKQPNNANGNQYYMSVEQGKMNDRNDNIKRYGVCEV